MEYAEGNSNNWIEHEEISLANLNQSQTCLTYNTVINAIDLQGYQTIKYRLVYKSPAQTGTLYLLYWSLDQLEIGEACVAPQVPQGQAHQTLPQDSTLADVVVTGANLRWYADEDLTQPLNSNDGLADMAYYWVTQTINGCESEPLKVMIHLTPLSTNDLVWNSLKVRG